MKLTKAQRDTLKAIAVVTEYTTAWVAIDDVVCQRRGRSKATDQPMTGEFAILERHTRKLLQKLCDAGLVTSDLLNAEYKLTLAGLMRLEELRCAHRKPRSDIYLKVPITGMYEIAGKSVWLVAGEHTLRRVNW